MTGVVILPGDVWTYEMDRTDESDDLVDREFDGKVSQSIVEIIMEVVEFEKFCIYKKIQIVVIAMFDWKPIIF